MQGQDVRLSLEFLQHLDLTFQEDAVDLVLEHLEVDDFDCDWFGAVVVAALVDLAAVALPDAVPQPVRVVLDLLASEAAAHQSNLKTFNNYKLIVIKIINTPLPQ